MFYFYFKDNIFGCIIEVIDFSEKLLEFIDLNVVVVGVSLDLEKSYGKFIDKYNLIV